MLVDAALRGILTPEARRINVDGLRILVPETVVLAGCQAAVISNFEAAIAKLARAGARIERRPLPQLVEAMALIAKHGDARARHCCAVSRTFRGSFDSREVRSTATGMSGFKGLSDCLENAKTVLPRRRRFDGTQSMSSEATRRRSRSG